MTQFTQDDLKGRNRFKEDFSQYYQIEDTGDYDHIDIQMTGYTNGQGYDVEIKKRRYNITSLSGNSMIEITKLDAFKEIHKKDPQRRLIYFNYYNDYKWIAFDMNGRLDSGLDMDNTYDMMLPCTTSANNGRKMKEVMDLSYQNNDKIKDSICTGHQKHKKN